VGDSLLGRLFGKGRKATDDAPENRSLAPPASARCQVCGSMAPFLDAVDFNKSCMDGTGKRLPPSGTLVRYHLCMVCGFCFAPEIQSWKREQFAASIYNDGYAAVDPDYLGDRPRANARTLHDAFGASKQHLRHLDYGGGSGLLSATLREHGWNSTSYDPFVDEGTNVQDLGSYDLVTAFEVFEHVPDIHALLQDLVTLCKPEGLILFSTLVSDGQIAQGARLTWWYASPRNGHISLFSSKSLTRWMSGKGLRFVSLNPNMHAAFHTVPPWASHLNLPG
jgi:SAM-dependent methyltransferase